MTYFSLAHALLSSIALISFNDTIATNAEPEFYMADQSNVAIRGYDVVSYFNAPTPMMGNPNFSHVYGGVTWLFSNEKNLFKFREDPEQYVPQYRGYCVWAISKGRLTGGDPTLSKVLDGKLYLLCSQEALDNWMKDPYTHIERANRNWEELMKLHPEK
ncbi:MAG: YHS domain-containing (seleno)protein [Chlamydiota bacterium]|nr:YHS domain-containing (seleno)protein [Chlamydiota bacterium]